ncbi:MAG: right-handed parallel beta-helix repeat-containing protein [Ruminococcus sp.]|nr:right-handed parallel beta-helix repeat-containing protein [Ruminococcus sp.]
MKKFLLRNVSVFLIMLFVISICSISVSSAVSYTNSKGTITVTCGKYKKKFTAKKYNKNFSKALNAALDTARKKSTAKKIATVKVSKGYYSLDRTIKIYSNTTLKATGCYFRLYGNLLRNGYNKKASSAKGYKGAKNITIYGGSWDAMVPYSQAGTSNSRIMHSTMRFGHCKNIVIKNCTFVNNYNCHDIELGGVDTAKITKCTFSNPQSVNTFPNDGGREAIQIDSCTYEAMPEFVSYDYTRSKNITVSYSTFKNKFRGVGSHHAVIGKTYDNINIHHNTFTNIGGIAIYAVYWTNSKIYNNTMTDVGLGVDMRNMTTGSGYNFYNYNKLTYAKAESAVKNKPVYIFSNNISLRKANNTYTRACGIRVLGENYTKDDSKTGVKAGTYKVYGVRVGVNSKGNTKPNIITGNVSVGVQLNYAVDSIVRGNSVDVGGSVSNSVNAIEIKGCENTIIDKNTVKNGYFEESKGILIMYAGSTDFPCRNVTATNNIVTDFDRAGIYDYGSENTVINNNSVSGSSESGIRVRQSKNTSVYKNSISNITDYALYVYGNSDSTSFTENSVSDAATGAYIHNSLNTTLSKNSITGCKEQGVTNRSSSYTTIDDNIIGCTAYAVRVSYGSDNTTITNNTLASLTTEAVYCIGSNDATKDVEKSILITNNVIGSADNFVSVRVQSANIAAHMWNNFTTDGTAASYRFKGENNKEFAYIYEDIVIDSLNLEKTATEDGEFVSLEWSPVEDVSGYRVYRTFGESTEQIDDITDTSYTDTVPAEEGVIYTIIPYKNYTNIKYLATPISVENITVPDDSTDTDTPDTPNPDEGAADTEITDNVE